MPWLLSIHSPLFPLSLLPNSHNPFMCQSQMFCIAIIPYRNCSWSIVLSSKSPEGGRFLPLTYQLRLCPQGPGWHNQSPMFGKGSQSCHPPPVWCYSSALSEERWWPPPHCHWRVLCRLTSKCVARAVQADAIRILSHLQVGVGIPAGCEAIVHSLSTTCKATLLRNLDVLF